MPLSLLLHETVYTIRWGAYHLEPWINLVRTEEKLIGRARSAFLVHWFGPRLPLERSFVLVNISNLAALRGRYFAVLQAQQAEADGPNLLEPLAGLAGNLAGVMLSPSGVILGIFVALAKMGPLLRMFGAKALLLPFGLLLGPGLALIAAGLLVPGGVAGVLLAGGQAAPAWVLLGSIASLLIAATGVLNLLSGPREAIANPMLRAILELFDRFAGLMPFVLAFIAIMVTRISPLIEPLAAQATPFQALVSEVFATVAFILGDIPDAFGRFWPMVADQIDFVLVQLSLIFTVFSIVLTEMFTNLAEQAAGIGGKAGDTLAGWGVKAESFITHEVKAHPLSRFIAGATLTFDVAGRLFPSSPSKPHHAPSSFPALKLTTPEEYMDATRHPPAGFEGIAPLAKLDMDYGLFLQQIPFSDDARAGVALALKPTQAFQAERGALERSLGGSSKRALADLRSQQMAFRDIVSAVVGRILPPELRTEVFKLRHYFDELDEHLYNVQSEKQADFPVQDLPDNGKLRPIVHRLVIRGIGVTRPDADTFQARLQERLTGQVYPAARPDAGLALVRN